MADSFLADQGVGQAVGDVGSALDRARVLENVVYAQRWDIEGLTAQRDAAFGRLADAGNELTALRAEVERLRGQITETELQATRLVNGLAGRSTASAAVRRRTMHVAAALALGTEPNGDPLCGMPREWMGEAVLIQASGLFDFEFYLRQIDDDCDLPVAICHYLMEGEAAGLLPNALFQPDFYAEQARSTGFGGSLGRFRSRLGHYAAIGAANGLRPGALVDYAWCFSQAPARDRESFEPIRFWLTAARAQDIVPHPLIDLGHYRRHRTNLRPDDDVLADYLLVGAGLHLSLSPLFDPRWYLDTYKDVREAGLDPLLHYVGYGEAEGRMPNPLFDPRHYQAQCPSPMAPGMSVLGHYIQNGRRGGAESHRLFDGAWYLQQNDDVRAIGCDPLQHYLEAGAGERRSPHPLFDVKFLLARHPALLRHHANPLIAFQRAAERLDASPHPLFDAAHYLAQVPEAADWRGGVFDHFLQFGPDNLADPHPLFCTAYYLEQLGAPPAGRTALAHYIAQGRGQGFRPHPLFDPWFYLRNNVDVARNGVDPLVHFVEAGGTLREHRQPHPLFDLPLYAARVGDLVGEDTNLLLDYMMNWRDRPAPHLLFDAHFYDRQSGDAALHANPLADYAWKGIEARRAPHVLFDPEYYERHVDVPGEWSRTLLEHYCMRQAPESFVPHPALDGELVAAQLTEDISGHATLLEHYVAQAGGAALDPHVLLAAPAYGMRHPDMSAGQDALSHFLARGGVAGWAGVAPERLKAEVCGTGGVAAANPHVARGRMMRHRLPERAVGAEHWHMSGRLKPGAKLALYAAHAHEAAVPLHAHALGALRKAGFTILFIDGALDAPRKLPRRLQRSVDATLSHVMGGQHMGSWVLACRLFGAEIARYEQVLFMSDNLVGPLGPMEKVWDSLAAASRENPAFWWALTASDQFTDIIDSDMFALAGQVVGSDAFTAFVQAYRFADTQQRGIEAAEQDVSRALLAAGLRPSLAASASGLRAAWLRGMPAQQRWFRELRAGIPDGLLEPLDATTTAWLADHGEAWVRRMAQDPSYGARLRPGLLFWDAILKAGIPFLRRDLLAANPLRTPGLQLLPRLLGPEATRQLAALIGPVLPDYADDMMPVLRLSRRIARLADAA